jgi:hypothetical protein
MYSKDDLIAALQLRYDAYSAGAVLEIARNHAELADKPTYDANELRMLRAAISAVGDRVGRVLDALDDLLASAPATDVKPAAAREATAKPPETVSDKVKSAPETSAAHAKDQVKTAPEKLVETRAQEKPTQGPTAVPAPAAAVAADATIVTTIVLAGFDPDEDDEILLCGASELLGDWDPARAKPMARAGDQWLAQLTIPAGTELAFKLSVAARTAT